MTKKDSNFGTNTKNYKEINMTVLTAEQILMIGLNVKPYWIIVLMQSNKPSYMAYDGVKPLKPYWATELDFAHKFDKEPTVCDVLTNILVKGRTVFLARLSVSLADSEQIASLGAFSKIQKVRSITNQIKALEVQREEILNED